MPEPEDPTPSWPLRGLRTRPLPGGQIENPNLILASLTASEQKRLEPFLELVHLKLHDVLMEPDAAIRHVYFPLNSVASVVQTMRDGSTVETGIIGREGMIGVGVWLGQKVASSGRVFIQVPGAAYRLKVDAFKSEVMQQPGGMNNCLGPYVDALLNQTAVGAACNRVHRVEERLCRWLKMMHNRVDGDTFPMRHEFLSYMLGVHRPSISIAANTARKAGLIHYERGTITVTNSDNLAAAACECYDTIEGQYERVYKRPFRK